MKNTLDEEYFESLLNIKTGGEQKIDNSSLHYNRYEPTSYNVLKSLFNNYTLSPNDSFVDFGSGKGRLPIFINYMFNCNATGIEMNSYFHKEALLNKENYLKKHKNSNNTITFIKSFAENYKVSKEDTIFYFFNPFSIQIFMKVVDKILLSLEENKRKVQIILYYPSEDYIFFLENSTFFNLVKEIPIPKLYSNNSRESFLIYELNY